MSSNVVIVAIPDENDSVWKVSSEKIPHLTLLFLGDKVANFETVVQFVEHAATTTLNRFHLPIDRRDELGADQADVLFFKRGWYDYKAIRDFRSTLLQDTNIRTAYNSATQFEGSWVPHLTLGYPANPAKPDPEFGFYDVSFNKIAVWSGNFDGPEFLLKDYWDECDERSLENNAMDMSNSEFSQTQTVVMGADFVEHHGVKGMKWGVRKVEGGSDKAHILVSPKTGKATVSKKSLAAIAVPAFTFPPLVPAAFLSSRVRAEVKAARAVNQGVRADKQLSKEEEKFRQHAQKASTFVAIHNGAGSRITREIESINEKYANVDLTKTPEKQAQYDSEVLKSMQDAYRESANSLTNKSATMHLDVSFHGSDSMDVKIEARKGAPKPMATHAIDDNDIITFSAKILRSSTGHIVGFEFDTPVEHSELELIDRGADFVEHYGIRGMHWGQRKHKEVSAKGHVDSGLIKRTTKVRATGGEAHPAHDDAIVAAVQKQKLKKSGIAALSNQELRELQTRLQLEAQVEVLASKKGKNFVTKQLEEEGKNLTRQGIREGSKRATPHVIKRAGKSAATAASVAALL